MATIKQQRLALQNERANLRDQIGTTQGMRDSRQSLRGQIDQLRQAFQSNKANMTPEQRQAARANIQSAVGQKQSLTNDIKARALTNQDVRNDILGQQQNIYDRRLDRSARMQDPSTPLGQQNFSNLLTQFQGSTNGSTLPGNYGDATGYSAPTIGYHATPDYTSMNDASALNAAMNNDLSNTRGRMLADIDSRVAAGGLPGSSRHGVMQALSTEDLNRAGLTAMLQNQYNAYDANQNRNAQLQGQAMAANAGLESARLGADASLQGQRMGNAAQLGVAGMNNATSLANNRMGLFTNLYNNALDRNASLFTNAQNRNQNQQQFDTNRYDTQQDKWVGRNDALLGYMGQLAQQADATQFGRQQLLGSYLGGKQGAMSGGLGYGGNLANIGAAGLGYYNSPWQAISQYAAGIGSPSILGSGSGSDYSLGRSNSTGFSTGASFGSGGGGSGGGGITIICTHLYNMGYMSGDLYTADDMFGKFIAKTMPEAYDGYIWWAGPFVKFLKKSQLATKLVSYLALPWANEMAHRMGFNTKRTLLGYALMEIGLKICNFIGHYISKDDYEVA